MNPDYLEDESTIADERAMEDVQDVLALQQPLSHLQELQPMVEVPMHTSIADAVQMMVDKRVGCLLIVNEGQLVGLFTERDVLRKVVVGGVDTASTPVSSLMTTNPDTLPVDSPLVFALQRMSVGGYRHVPLLDDRGNPVAVVSMRDIVGYIVSLYPGQILNLPDQPARWTGRDGA